MGFMETLWGRIKIKALECTKLYLPNASGVPTLVTATADDLNAAPSGVGNGTITDAKLATDVKVGSLAALTTTAKGSVQAALNEVDAHADAAYVKPGTGIPAADMAAAVQTSLGKADTALQVGTGVTRIAKKSIQLCGANPTPVAFKTDTVPFIAGIAVPTNMQAVGDNGTIKITYDSEAEETATLNCTGATHTGGNACKTDMTAETDTKIKIRANGDVTWHTLTFDWVGGSCDTLAEIATEIQTKVQALGATYGYSRITVVGAGGNHLVFTSVDKGTASTIEIDRAADHDACDDLDIGPNGTTVVGTGDVANIYAVTPAEIATLINGDMSRADADASSGTLIVTGAGVGRSHKITAGNGTINTLCGIPNLEVGYGAQGMGQATDWGDALYNVLLTYRGTGAAAKDLGWDTPTIAGFNVTCETAADTGYVDILVVG